MPNKTNSKTQKPRILVLRTPDEMRHPYATALRSLKASIEWIANYKTLLARADAGEYAVVLVDLECLPNPIEKSLEELRIGFAKSDLIALSSTDSATLAMQCVHAGFTDFFLKPTSPEQLAWSVRRCLQRSDVVRKLDSRSDVLRALTRISSCSTPILVRMSVLEYVKTLTHAKGGAWTQPGRGKNAAKVLASTPKGMLDAQVLLKTRKVEISKNVFVWGIEKKIDERMLSEARLIVEHGEQSLLNISKYEEIRQQTFLDDLTGLYNSRYLKFALGNAMAKCARGSSFSVLFLDVDHFKTVNDVNGHVVGSQFLIAIGKTIKNIVRNIDPVFRYGGDEFVVILQGTSLEGARDIAERIRKGVERRVFVMDGKKLQTTVSIGIATYPDHASKKETLLKLADEAMYSAKKSTRNSVQLALAPLPPAPAPATPRSRGRRASQ